MVQVLFVCLGNICRSAMAQGMLLTMAKDKGLEIEIDSAGTSNWHVGNPPDERAQTIMAAHGIDISSQRARQVEPADLDRFDYIIAMDDTNLAHMSELADDAQAGKLHLFMNFAPHANAQYVPDPYYGGPEDYEHAFALIEQASKGLCENIQARS